MRKGKDPMNTCQNCIHGNNKKGKWKFSRRTIRDEKQLKELLEPFLEVVK